MMNALEGVRSIVAAHFRVHASKVQADTTWDAICGDDLDRIEVVMTVEDNFRVQLSDDDMQEFRTVGDLAGLVDRRLAERREAVRSRA